MKTILIVDDEYPTVDSLTVFLKTEGYRVVSASNGEEGMAQLMEEKSDMVLVDFMMRILDGPMFVREMRTKAEFRTLPVVMMSAGRERTALMAGLDGGKIDVAAFLQKPFLIKDLLSAVRSLIGAGEPTDGV